MGTEAFIGILSLIGAFGFVMVIAYFLFIAGQKSHPPYHTVNAEGDIIVYIYANSKYSRKYHEYPFVHTVNGLKYKMPVGRKIAGILWLTLTTAVFVIPVVSIIIQNATDITLILPFLAGYLIVVGIGAWSEKIQLRVAENYIAENGLL